MAVEVINTNVGKAVLSGSCEATAALYPGQQVFPLSSSPVKAYSVTISQRRLNSGASAQLAVYVGDANVTVLIGQELAAPAAAVALDRIVLTAPPGRHLDLSTVYVLFLQDADGVTWQAVPI